MIVFFPSSRHKISVTSSKYFTSRVEIILFFQGHFLRSTCVYNTEQNLLNEFLNKITTKILLNNIII